MTGRGSYSVLPGDAATSRWCLELALRVTSVPTLEPPTPIRADLEGQGELAVKPWKVSWLADLKIKITEKNIYVNRNLSQKQENYTTTEAISTPTRSENGPKQQA